MGLIQGCAEIQKQLGGWEITQLLAGCWEGEGLSVALTDPERRGKAAAVLLSQPGGDGEESDSLLHFRALAFFCPSTFCKCLMLGIAFSGMKFLWGGKMDVFFLEGTSLLPPSCQALPPHTRRARLKIDGSAWRFNYSSVGRGGE